MSTHVSSRSLLSGIFLALVTLTILTVSVAYVDLGAFNTPLAIGIATLKAFLVAIFFMELRFSHRLTWVAAVTGVLFLALLMGLTLSDVVTRNWLGFPGT